MSRTSQGVDRRCLIDLFDACIEEHAGLLILVLWSTRYLPTFVKFTMAIALSVSPLPLREVTFYGGLVKTLRRGAAQIEASKSLIFYNVIRS